MSTAYKKFSDGNFQKKVVVVRADLDVPTLNGEILDDTKIRNLIPTLQELVKAQAKVVILASLGAQNGEYSDENSLMQVRFQIGNLLEKPIKFVDLERCDNSIKFMEFGDVLLLENLFFHKEEFKAKPEERDMFITHITQYADFFINEAFGIDETFSSIAVSSKKLKSYYGLGYQKNLECLTQLNKGMREPSVLILGGKAEVSKISAIKNIVTKFNQILVGGEISLYFLASKGVKIGKTELDEKILKKVTDLIKIIESKKIQLILPVDHIVSEELESETGVDVDVQVVPNNKYVVDIGEKTLVLFREVIESAKTIVWYGPVGRFEIEAFNRGTESIGEYVALSAGKDCIKYALGTSTLVAINKLKVKHKRFNCLVPNAEAFLSRA
jgi:3-phosphoglycerate kinase